MATIGEWIFFLAFTEECPYLRGCFVLRGTQQSGLNIEGVLMSGAAFKSRFHYKSIKYGMRLFDKLSVVGLRELTSSL